MPATCNHVSTQIIKNIFSKLVFNPHNCESFFLHFYLLGVMPNSVVWLYFNENYQVPNLEQICHLLVRCHLGTRGQHSAAKYLVVF